MVTNDFVAEEFEAVEAFGRIGRFVGQLPKLPRADGVVGPHFSMFEDEEVFGLVATHLSSIRS